MQNEKMKATEKKQSNHAENGDVAERNAAMTNGSGTTGDVRKRTVYPDYEDAGPNRLKEAEVAYGRGKRQGEYTLDDYYALPDDIRAKRIRR